MITVVAAERRDGMRPAWRLVRRIEDTSRRATFLVPYMARIAASICASTLAT
jgi:hypothetical protein